MCLGVVRLYLQAPGEDESSVGRMELMLRKAEGADRGEGVLRPSVSEANLIPALPLAFITSQWCFESVRYIWIPASCNTMPKAHSK